MSPNPRVFAAVVFAALIGTNSGEASEWPITHVVSPNGDVAALLELGDRQSPTFHRLVEAIERSTWMVFILAGACPNKHAIGCLLHTTGTFEGRRYLRIVVQRAGRHPDSVVATIGHELQHALEVIESAEAGDAGSIDALFQRIGTKVRAGGGTLYETAAAQRAGDQVLRELRRSARQLH